MRRRRYLRLGCATMLAGLAGCTSAESGNTSQATTTGTTVESSTASSRDTTTSTATEPTDTETATPADFTVEQVSIPDSAERGDEYAIEIEVRNEGEHDGVYHSEIELATTAGPEPDGTGSDPSEWTPVDVDLFVPGGETETWRRTVSTYEAPSVDFVRMADGSVYRVDIPDSKAPIIETVNLVSEWSSFGDVVENEIGSESVGSGINIGYRYWYWAENNTFEIFDQVEIYDASDDRVDIENTESEQVIEWNGWNQWESSRWFDTTGWTPGTYTVEVLVRDEQSKAVSEKATGTFELE